MRKKPVLSGVEVLRDTEDFHRLGAKIASDRTKFTELIALIDGADLPRTKENEDRVVGQIERFAHLVLSFPGDEVGHLSVEVAANRAIGIDGFEKTPAGRMFWRGVTWLYGDDFISLSDAAALTNTSLPNISRNATVDFFIPVQRNGGVGRRVLRESQVRKIWGIPAK